jgi:hypothetical protein
MADPRRERRHPFRGFFGGLLFGLGLALLLLSYAVVPFGAVTPWVVIGAFTVLGLLSGLFGPRRRGMPAPP